MLTQKEYEQTKTAKEISDINKYLNIIEQVFQSMLIDDNTLKKIVEEINDKYKENTVVYKIITNRPNSINESVPVQNANRNELLQDLQWKHFYLQAKLLGKTIEEIKKDWDSKKADIRK